MTIPHPTLFNMHKTLQLFRTDNRKHSSVHSQLKKTREHLHLVGQMSKKDRDIMDQTWGRLRNRSTADGLAPKASMEVAVAENKTETMTKPVKKDLRAKLATYELRLLEKNVQVEALKMQLMPQHTNLKELQRAHQHETTAKDAEIEELKAALDVATKEINTKDEDVRKLKDERRAAGRRYWDRCNENKKLQWRIKELEEEQQELLNTPSDDTDASSPPPSTKILANETNPDQANQEPVVPAPPLTPPQNSLTSTPTPLQLLIQLNTANLRLRDFQSHAQTLSQESESLKESIATLRHTVDEQQRQAEAQEAFLRGKIGGLAQERWELQHFLMDEYRVVASKKEEIARLNGALENAQRLQRGDA
ncbi:unnamed protein product [Periconia digitata]|uniref:Uncharacterized protein n=1 Tax=Periconia digitata TaxID=1303443 RepID=A0A9W4XIP2_9PLEO|nr:unnamed protein product [Periconia digitata]